ncbi:MAG: restriction endonuclease subunit S, partial [Pseudomonadota bacterium]|nr:restriction endonuclease subunit S [Pseudomonadota bacterium]
MTGAANTVPLMRVMRLKSGDFITADEIEAEGAYPVYGGNGLRGYTDRWNTEGPIALIGRQGAHCGNVHIAPPKCWVSEHAFRCLPEKSYSVAFIRFALETLSLNQYSVSAAQPGLSTDNLKPLPIPFPPPETQKRIAAFLDEKTAQIDGLIARKQALLARLAEKRQAIITQAVTKGLNPAAPMKDSGIDWLGQIPAHWEVMPLRRMASRVVTGRTPPATAGDFFTDGEVPWFTPGDFKGTLVLDGSEKCLAHDAFSEGHAVLYPPNSVLLVGIGATLGKVGVASMVCSSNQQINAITPLPGNDAVFLAYFLHGFRNEVRVAASGNTLPGLPWKNWSNSRESPLWRKNWRKLWDVNVLRRNRSSRSCVRRM